MAVLALATLARADVRLPNLFGDHMVLQRDAPVAVWGRAEPGESVSVKFAGQAVGTKADGEGKWRVVLAPIAMRAQPSEMEVAGKNTLRFQDVVVGDVWLCSGQSNMAMSLDRCDSAADLAAADLPGIRFLVVGGKGVMETRFPSAYPEEDIARDAKAGLWHVVQPQSAGDMSGVAFYFARKVYKETGVPIGLLDSSVGGTRIESWFSPDAALGISELADLRRQYEEKVVRWRASLPAAIAKVEPWAAEAKKALANGGPIPREPEWPGNPVYNPGDNPRGVPYGLYYGMIHPLRPWRIKGVTWYQGEGNVGEGTLYVAKMRALVAEWRKAWGQGDFPFYFVQLASLGPVPAEPPEREPWAELREAQRRSLSIPNTGMAVAIDVGEAADIHPKNKFDVGERLARWALARDYGKKDLVPCGPLYRDMKVEGPTIRVAFDHGGSGLMVGRKAGRAPAEEVKDGKLQRFAIAGADRKWQWAEARIDGATVILSCPLVSAPVAARYAFAANPEGCNLYNREGLPASPFRTDDW